MFENSFYIEVLLPVVILVIFVVLIFSIPMWISSCKQAEIYNIQNKTQYTCSDFFWASEQINQQTQTIILNPNK